MSKYVYEMPSCPCGSQIELNDCHGRPEPSSTIIHEQAHRLIGFCNEFSNLEDLSAFHFDPDLRGILEDAHSIQDMASVLTDRLIENDQAEALIPGVSGEVLPDYPFKFSVVVGFPLGIETSDGEETVPRGYYSATARDWNNDGHVTFFELKSDSPDASYHLGQDTLLDAVKIGCCFLDRIFFMDKRIVSFCYTNNSGGELKSRQYQFLEGLNLYTGEAGHVDKEKGRELIVAAAARGLDSAINVKKILEEGNK